MKIKDELSLKDRIIIWALKFLLLIAIPAIWIEWSIYLSIKMHEEIVQTGDASWESIINLFIILSFTIKFLRDSFKKGLYDD